jgi:hypothetical protein
VIGFSEGIAYISDWSLVAPADIFLIAVSDDAIRIVSEQIPLKNQLIVHTSGSVSFEEMSKDNRRGVFYPLQTFTKGKQVDFREIPICIESEFSADLEIIKKLANTISEKIYIINSQQRKALHVAAVFVNNFVNHLYQIGNEICLENQVPFEILDAYGDGICCSYGNGVYTVKDATGAVLATGGEFGDIEVKSFKTGVLSVDELNTIALNVYPNPASDVVNVSFEAANADYAISLMDLQGRVVSTQMLSNAFGTQLISFSTESISKGSYIVSIKSNGMTTTSNVVVK